MAAVLLRVPLLFMAALGLAIIDPEELLLVGDSFGFLAGDHHRLLRLYGRALRQSGMGAACCGGFRRFHGAPNIAPGVTKNSPVIILQLWWLEQQTDFVLKPLVSGLRSPVLFNWALKRLGAENHPKAFIAQSTEWYGPLSLISIGARTP